MGSRMKRSRNSESMQSEIFEEEHEGEMSMSQEVQIRQMRK